MKILAIDPGPQESQWLLWGATITTCHVANNDLAVFLRGGFSDVTHVAIEMIASYGMPVGREVFETCYYIGRLMEICSRRDLKVLPVYRKEIIIALCGSPRAKDTNVRQALIDLIGQPGTKAKPGSTYGVSKHGWSALAIAWFARNLIETSPEGPRNNPADPDLPGAFPGAASAH